MDLLFEHHFDYIFIGLGAGNSLLLKQLFQQNQLNGKRIAVIEPALKNKNDRTFCFWSTQEELIRLELDSLVYKQWTNIKVSGREEQNISPKNYYCIQSIDLYKQTQSILQNIDVTYFDDCWNGTPALTAEKIAISIQNKTLSAPFVFDSRPPQFLAPQKNESNLYQSFFGWVVEVPENTFDTSTAILMDFDIDSNGLCEFMYVLPFSERRALIEITRFGKDKMTEEHANEMLRRYVEKNSKTYNILEKERGIIPMSTSPIDRTNFGKRWIYTGTAAGLLKPSTGYAFHAMAIDALNTAHLLSEYNDIDRTKQKPRFLFYDRLLLKILEKNPEKGRSIFEQLFSRIPLDEVLIFLNEKTSIRSEIKIFSRLPKFIFLKAAVQDLFFRISSLSPSLISLIFCLLSCLLFASGYNTSVWALLSVGFFTIGLSHGSLDHLNASNSQSTAHLALFILKYLLLAAILAMGWLFIPDIALIFFLLYSALHFGETDFNEWNISSKPLSFLWGLSVLTAMLTLHFNETIWVLKQIPNIRITDQLITITRGDQLFYSLATIFILMLWPFYYRKKTVLFSVLFLILTYFLPLLVSFGIYFVFQHSISGWKHLQNGHQKQSKELWMQSLPFVIGATGIIIGGLTIISENMWGVFFIILSCMSMPHVFSMNRFYQKHVSFGR